MNTTPNAAADSYVGPHGWRPWLRGVASVLILFHVTAVIVAPCAVDPTSMMLGWAFTKFQPYLDAAYLNHGYHFFAPEPGPSHLVRYELVLPGGERREGVFPNLDEEWPRLLYHRHFMLSERLASAPPETPWVQAWARSYGEHLLEKHGADQATLYLRRHLIPYPTQVLEGMKLDDGRLYEELRLGIYAKDAH